MTAPEDFLRTLVESLRLVASDRDAQVAAHPGFVDVPDEISLVYEDSFLLVDQIHNAGLINDTTATKLKALAEHFDRMSERRELWTLRALADSPEWEQGRRLAKDILRDLGGNANLY